MMSNQVGLLGVGQSEYFIFAPHQDMQVRYLVCIGIDEGAEPAEADYRVTLVNFYLSP